MERTQNLQIRTFWATASLLAILFGSTACTKAQLIGKKSLSRLLTLSVLQIYPPSGTYLGGTLVTLTGTGFRAGAVVTIGGAPCTGVTVQSTTTLTCTTTSHAQGSETVLVSIPGVGDNSWATYTYLGDIKAKSSRIASGGGFSSGTGIRASTTVGALTHSQTSNVRTATGMRVVGGIEGFQY